MSKWQFNHFPNKGHLFPTATNIVIPHIISLFFILPFDGLTLSEKEGLWDNNTKFTWFSGNDFELNWLKCALGNEQVILFDGTVSIFEVWENVGFSKVTRYAFDCIV